MPGRAWPSITRGAHGALAFAGGEHLRSPRSRSMPIDTTGAGDVFRGAFAWAVLGAGVGARRALALAAPRPGSHAAAPARRARCRRPRK